jgi:putative intracellular protease/amidase
VPNKAVYFFAVPGFSDWEAAHALAELRRYGHYRVEVVGFTREPVQSMGGLPVQPTCGLAEVDPAEVAMFILPGGDRWEELPVEPEVVDILTRLDASAVPIAAICGATTAVVRAGLLRGRRHTSNGLSYLKQHVPEYSESTTYVDAPAVRDRGLITASGLADVEFAQEIMAELGVLSEDERATWVSLFRGGRIPTGSA